MNSMNSRCIIFFAALIISSVANAGCFELARLDTKGMSIDISDGGCASAPMITFSVKGAPLKVVRFEDECVLKADESSFSCKRNGRSPLAGATYKLILRGEPYCDKDSPDAGETPGQQFVCVKGCSKSTPKYLT